MGVSLEQNVGDVGRHQKSLADGFPQMPRLVQSPRRANGFGKPPLPKMMTSHSSSEDLANSFVHYMGSSDGESSEGEVSSSQDSPIHNGLDAVRINGKMERRSSIDARFQKDAAETEEKEEDEDEFEDQEVEGYWENPEEKLASEQLSFGVDSRDIGTSDEWIERKPSLVRLTGRHPFNCEAPMSELMDAGFITPANIHYVRNHGYVPRGNWDDWRIEVTGRVKSPTKLSMNDLLTKFSQREFPCTLVCAGNRRKEQNMTSQTIGFNWGAAAVSNSVWKGVRLCEVLRYCGVMSRTKGALYVCFEGAETLPGAGGTKYGTSVSIDKAMDEAQDIILAYEQNGRRLLPDHGFPVRVIIPGYVGGRMVKWLTAITVSPQESQNHYHFNDNRVLPPHVDAERAKAEGWFYKPDYIINEMNINSAITTPAHNEILPFGAAQKPYTVKGYAYSGGGKKVTRVELSLDGGETWRFCNITHLEKPTKHGKYWCWVHWNLDVEVTDFLQSKEIVVRAWDSTLNTQPEHLTWNVMGMMNNCWFRVKIQACRTPEGGIGLNFEHPTCPGNQPGGWMAKQKKVTDQKPQPAALEPAAPAKRSMVKSSSTPSFRQPIVRQISMFEVRRHTHSESAWIVVNGSVYDCTAFLHDHPGGVDSILITAGTDATEEFDAIHSDKAKVMLEKYKIGELSHESENDFHSAGSTPDSSLRGGNNFKFLSTISEVPQEDTDLVALNPKERIAFQLIEKEDLSATICKLRFALQSKEHILGLPVGKHVLIAANINGKLVMRAYTPISCDKDVGYFDLLVKIYFRNDSFPSGGLMSQHLGSLTVGESIMVKGPLGHIQYKGKGEFEVHGHVKHARKFAMIAGGTGITPMYQVIRAILENPSDHTDVSLIYCNRNESDIMLKEQLDEWQEKHCNFRVWYTVTSGHLREGWKYSRCRMNENMMREHLPPGSPDTSAFICGPPAMESSALEFLEHMGYDRNSCFSF
ncbi:hypothetical protein R1sor_013757 [Riccia sorocarpa]|uniref:Nitrate reductase n=1 Tax=Riccia sorocarpa TaxID=122646 RepID=A0ABD3H7M0_9MARC